MFMQFKPVHDEKIHDRSLTRKKVRVVVAEVVVAGRRGRRREGKGRGAWGLDGPARSGDLDTYVYL